MDFENINFNIEGKLMQSYKRKSKNIEIGYTIGFGVFIVSIWLNILTTMYELSMDNFEPKIFVCIIGMVLSVVLLLSIRMYTRVTNYYTPGEHLIKRLLFYKDNCINLKANYDTYTSYTITVSEVNKYDITETQKISDFFYEFNSNDITVENLFTKKVCVFDVNIKNFSLDITISNKYK